MKRIRLACLIVCLLAALAGCAAQTPEEIPQTQSEEIAQTVTVAAVEHGVYDAGELFTNRDLRQAADLSAATRIDVRDGEDVSIRVTGIFVLSGSAKNVTITVQAGAQDKVQLVLDGLTIENENAPCIHVLSADKVFVTTTDTVNELRVTGGFDLDEKPDGVIFSKSDLVLNGVGTLKITSPENGVVSKDDLKITGGKCVIRAQSKAVEANDSIRIAGGELTLVAGTDGLHAENKDNDRLGYVLICGGTLDITAGDDGVHAGSVVQIDDGSLTVRADEGVEGTYLQINGGSLAVRATGDGLNAGRKSAAYQPLIEINGGEITIVTSAGDNDCIDSNGDVVINGGVVDVTGSYTFDYVGTAAFNGGTLIINGQTVDAIPNQPTGR